MNLQVFCRSMGLKYFNLRCACIGMPIALNRYRGYFNLRCVYIGMAIALKQIQKIFYFAAAALPDSENLADFGKY